MEHIIPILFGIVGLLALAIPFIKARRSKSNQEHTCELQSEFAYGVGAAAGYAGWHPSPEEPSEAT